MRKLSTKEMGRLSPEAALQARRLPVVIVLDNLRSAMNVGSVFRSADAFRAASVVLCGVTAVPPHREILKTALGATESVPWQYFQDTTSAILSLKSMGYRILALEQTSESVQLQNFITGTSDKYAIVLGNEVSGINEEALQHCDMALEIPQGGTKHSLNVSVCAGIVLWEFARRTTFP